MKVNFGFKTETLEKFHSIVALEQICYDDIGSSGA
jgi:hypothetical protein